MKRYTQENLINHLSLAKENDVVFLLGAGCSINSGCMAAGKLITEFKRRIYCARQGIKLSDNLLINDDKFIKIINEELPSDMDNPYSYYFEKCFPDYIDRSKFIKEKFQSISPSFGYLCFANYLIKNQIRTILTTNFDNLCDKAIRKLDDSYDITFESDDISPMLLSKLNIVKLHGDYNYDCLRNTEDELNSLSNNISSCVLKSRCKEIVVLGYSGMDHSVMSVLDKLSKNNIKIIWCILEKYHHDNQKIESLFAGNDNSGYCFIDGFDELFSKIYSCQGHDNNLINNLFRDIGNGKFVLNIDSQPESMQYNANELTSSPLCYKVSGSLTGDSLKEINNKNQNSFVMQNKEFLYVVGNIEEIKNQLRIDERKVFTSSICDEMIPVDKKCKLIKELLKINCRTRGFNVFKDNIFKDNGDEIKEGLEISIELFNGKLCLFTNVNYFSLVSSENDSIKFQINKMKSNLYAIRNYEKRNELFDDIFGLNLKFDAFNTCVEFDKNFLENIGGNSNIYNCSQEPEMVVDNNCSVNQIKLLNEFGPRTTLFSNDSIRIGVFCPTDDKPKLKRYFDLLLNGTKVKQNLNVVIPQYAGFLNIFKKQIIIDYDGLPDFSTNQLTNAWKFNFDSFKDFCLRGIKKLYDERNVDIVLIYISNKLVSFRTQNDSDLHDIIKLECANKYKTQFLEEKTIDSSDDINKKIYNLAIGIFTKTVGMSWYPKNYSKETLFLGMSFGKDVNGITVGCSQMFDGAGRGMQLIISQMTDKHRKNQYLSLEEAYNLGTKIRTTYYKTSKIDELKRIVIHRCDPFRTEEIEGFKKAFEGIDDFDLIQISDYAQFNCYCFRYGECRGFPVRRGTTIKSSKDNAFVWTDGSVISSDIMNGNTYRNNKRGMGRPLKIKKYYGNISINEVVDDLMYLTKMDFNSSDVIYSKYPVTIKYSQVVCELLKQGNFDDELISFEYII